MQTLEPKLQKKIISIISLLMPDAKIYLFGSRARKTNQEFSDIDLAIDAGRTTDHMKIAEIRDVLRALNMPYMIDVVDFHQVSPEMKKEIMKEGVIWKA